MSSKRSEPLETAYRFDLPYGARAPRMINPEIGLCNVVARAGHNAAYTIDVTLLDAPDHRLVRSGVLLAHRVLAGRGEWYLGAPDWAPLLPGELIEPMSQAELPDSFADLVAPFRRRATLGPVAAISCERSEFAVRDDHGHTLALVRDDKVTVRRGGLTTARYRQVLLTPVGDGLTTEQVDFLRSALGHSGATPVARFPRLVARLGAPATGLTDFPEPAALDQGASFEAFVSALLAGRQRDLLRADLAVRGGEPGAADRLRAVAVQLRDEVQGMAAVLQPLWSQDLAEELDWLVEVIDSSPAPQELSTRLRGERYLTLLERLVNATRAPQLGDSSTSSSGEVLSRLVGAAVQSLVDSGEQTKVDAPELHWTSLQSALTTARQTVGVAAGLDPKWSDKLRGRLDAAAVLLGDVQAGGAELVAIRAGLEGASVTEAFEAGRRFSAEQQRLERAREAFCDQWPRLSAKLIKLAGKPVGSDRPAARGKAGKSRRPAR